VIKELREEIRAGVPVVGVEPSCAAVFKDELRKLLPDDEDAKRLCQQTFHFADFLKESDLPRLVGKAIVHGHCHHRATGGISGEKELLERMGLEVEELESGCCGMAGAWGYEPGHYEVSMVCAERVLLPKIRAAASDTLVVADGFSCKTQIEQSDVDRCALHVAQVVQLAQTRGAELEPFPERRVPTKPPAQ
jgi:Fe-S oxidoreductase